MRVLIACIIFFTFSNFSNGQIGGYGVYKFLNLPASSRVGAMGGVLINSLDNDVSLSTQNPALYNPLASHKLSMSYINYVSDINYGTFNYAQTYEPWATTLGGGVQYINYGDFLKTDETGNVLGSFSASEFAIHLGGARTYKQIHYGANLKFIQSQLDIYKSNGLALDLGGYYQNEEGNFSAALVTKNIGVQLTTYSDKREQLPFELQASVAYKLKHAPFKFYLTGHNLQLGDISYTNTNKPQVRDFSTGKIIEEKVSITDKIGRHIIGGTELIFGKNFKIQFSYNHKMRKELSLPDARGMTGYSLGAWMKINKFYFSYGRTNIHIAGGSNLFSFGLDLGAILKPTPFNNTVPTTQPESSNTH